MPHTQVRKPKHRACSAAQRQRQSWRVAHAPRLVGAAAQLSFPEFASALEVLLVARSGAAAAATRASRLTARQQAVAGRSVAVMDWADATAAAQLEAQQWQEPAAGAGGACQCVAGLGGRWQAVWGLYAPQQAGRSCMRLHAAAAPALQSLAPSSAQAPRAHPLPHRLAAAQALALLAMQTTGTMVVVRVVSVITMMTMLAMRAPMGWQLPWRRQRRRGWGQLLRTQAPGRAGRWAVRRSRRRRHMRSCAGGLGRCAGFGRMASARPTAAADWGERTGAQGRGMRCCDVCQH